MNFDFYMPVRVVSGRTALADSAAQLKKLGDSCMVVTGKCSAKASGALDDLTEVLRREKMERFLRVLDTDLPAVNQLLDSLSGVERISMTKEEIQSYRKRFTGLKHYANTPGAYSEEQGLRLFETLFLK